MMMNKDFPAGKRPQRYLGKKGLIALIAVLSAFVPLSTDLYIPALPSMSGYFGVSDAVTNLTLILFFVFFSLGMLFWGPLSDKYGRRPVLLTGLSIYIVASAACALSWDISVLISSRVLQAIGGSAASAVSTAMVKDVYSGRQRESVLAVVQSMVVISPAVAPVIGAFMLPYTSWRGLFWGLGLIGVVSLIGCLLLEETLAQRFTGTMFQSFRKLGTALKNPGFSSLLVVFSMVSIASMAFIAESSYIYEDGFDLSAQSYSYYFAFNAIGMMSGPFLYLWLSRRYTRKKIVLACFSIMTAAGALVYLFGDLGPAFFALALFPSTLMGSCVRPGGTYLMLEQQRDNAGAAAALINCSSLILGSLGILMVSMFADDLIIVIGILNVAVGSVCALAWMSINKRKVFSEVPGTSRTAK